MSSRIKRLLAPLVGGKANGNGHAPPVEVKEYPASGVTFVGGAGAFTNRSINWLEGFGVNPDAEELGRTAAFVTAAYCWTAMMWRMQRAAEPPLMIVKETEDGEEWQPNHHLVELFDTPRPDLEMSEIISRTVGYQDITGGALWKLDRDVLARRRQITPFSASEFRSEKKDGLIYGAYEILTGGRWKPVEIEDVIHFREPNVLSWRDCTSRVDVALIHLNLGHTVSRITRRYLLRAMFPGGIISPDPEWHPSDDEWDAWKQTIEAWHGGPSNAGAPLTLQGGTTFSRTASGMADLLPSPVLDRVEATVGSVFGVPPVVMGWLTGLQNSPWSQMAEARRQAIEDTVQPIWSMIEKRLTRGLLTREERADGLLVRFDLTQVRALSADEERQARISQTNADTWTVNERRIATGMEPLAADDPRGELITGIVSFPEPGLSLGNGEDDPEARATDSADAAETGDVAATALNGAQVAALVEIVSQVSQGLIPATSAAAIVRASFPLLTDEQVADIFDDVEEGSAVPAEGDAAKSGELCNAHRANKQLSSDARDLLWLMFDLHTKANEPGWERGIAAELNQYRREMIAAARANIKEDATDVERKALLSELSEDIKAERVPGWINRTISKRKPQFIAKVYPLLTKTGGTGVRRLAARLRLSFSVLEPGLLKYSRREAAFLAEVMGKTTGRAVARAVQEGLEAGETIGDLVKRLTDLPAFNRERAKLVARSETTRAWNGAQRTSMSEYQKRSGNKVFKSWLSARDDRVRDEHVALDDGTEIPIDSAFDNGLTEPGEPNCRCSLTYRVADDEEGDVEIEEPSEETE